MLKKTLLTAAVAFSLMGAPAQSAELRFAGTTPALTMDPHATNDFVTTAIFRQVYDSIVGFTLDMDLAPALATEWEYLGDNTWRFKLREGVTFHDGTPMTADDVAFSIMREKASSFYTALFGGITEAKVVDPLTVDVVSAAPDPVLPRKMTRLFVMSKTWAETNNSVAIPDLGAEGAEAFSVRHANGTGPMKLVSHDPAVRTEFERNANYWGDWSGNVDKATYLPIGSAPTRVAALLSGEVDLIVDLPLQDIKRVAATPGFKIEQSPQFLWMQLEMDGSRDVALDTWNKDQTPITSNPFKDVRVRQAIGQAIDASLIVDRVMLGNARVVGIPSVPGLGGYQEDLDTRWPTDVEHAKQLLAEAGYPDGFITQLNCPLERYVNTDDICRAVASMLAQIGIEVRVNGTVWPEFARMLVNGPSSSFHLIGTAPNSFDTQDAFTSTMMTRDAEKKEGFFNWALYSNPIVDKVSRELPVAFDEAERTRLYREGLEAARDTVSAVYLHQPMISWGMEEGITAPIRSDATLTLQNVTVPQ
jgi:peptide/nickel transport system substrate-binding protein